MEPSWENLFISLIQAKRLWNGYPTRCVVVERLEGKDFERVRQSVQAETGQLPAELVDLLQECDGIHAFVWVPDRMEGGVKLFSLRDLPAPNGYAYASVDDDPGPGKRPYFVFGEIEGTGNYLGLDDKGNVVYLDHEYGVDEWRRDRGIKTVSGSIRGFLTKLIEERGRLWWEGGRHA